MSAPLPCRHCDETEEAHHAFEPYVLPKGCVCDWREWGCQLSEIPKICSEWSPDHAERPLCVTCEHEPGCHGAQA